MISIYYDGECPFCSRYIHMLRLSKTSQVELVDLRNEPGKSAEFNAAGYNLDEGMVVQANGRDYYGSDAISYLAALSTPSNLLNRLNSLILSNPVSARILYPFLRAGRWFVLFLLNRAMIGDTEDSALARREIFTSLFALYSIFHSFYFSVAYGSPTWDLILIFMASIFALAKPNLHASLFAMALAGTVSGIVQMPTQSNHALLALLASLAYLASVCIAMVRNDRFPLVFARFAPAGCGLLLVMYFFGIFHKLNSDFLNPLTSCAMALWREMPQPLASLDGPLIEYSAIYGTFIVEGLIMLALIIRRTRHIGVAVGMAFHLLLSLSNYAMYIAFSTLTIALHSLFLNEAAAQSVLRSPLVRLVKAKLREPIYWLALTAVLALIAVLALVGNFSEASLVALLLILPFCYAILRFGATAGAYSKQGLWLAAVFTGLYFVNCSLPYAGLKTAQAGNMFANLRLEAGISNHIVFSSDRRPLGYLDNVAILEQGEDGIVFYDLLSSLETDPSRTVTFEMNGQTHQDKSAKDFEQDIEDLHPRWVRKWFHFQSADLEQPQTCGI